MEVLVGAVVVGLIILLIQWVEREFPRDSQ